MVHLKPLLPMDDELPSDYFLSLMVYLKHESLSMGPADYRDFLSLMVHLKPRLVKDQKNCSIYSQFATSNIPKPIPFFAPSPKLYAMKNKSFDMISSNSPTKPIVPIPL